MGGLAVYLLNLTALLIQIVPCFLLSVVFARKKKPLIGGALALSKVILTYRAGKIWEEMLRSSGKIGWEHFGFQYVPLGAVILVSLLVAGTACVILNLYVFWMQPRPGRPAVQA